MTCARVRSGALLAGDVPPLQQPFIVGHSAEAAHTGELQVAPLHPVMGCSPYEHSGGAIHNKHGTRRCQNRTGSARAFYTIA